MKFWSHEVIYDLVFTYLKHEDQAMLLRLCKSSRLSLLRPANELKNMLECLELTLGWWRGTGQLCKKDEVIANVNQKSVWCSKLEEHIEELNQQSFRGESLSLDKLDEEIDCLDLEPIVNDLTNIETPSLPDSGDKLPPVSSWFMLRLILEQEVVRHRSPDFWLVGNFKWRRIPDGRLDALSLQLRHFSRDWLRGATNYRQDEYHMYVGVYEPDVSQEELDADDWYIGRHVMVPSNLEDIEDMERRTRDYSHAVFQFTDNPSDILCLRICSLKEDCYQVLKHYWWIESLMVSPLRQEGRVPRMAYVPFIIRVLLTQQDLLFRLCDVNDSSITPFSFLSEVQQYSLHGSAQLLGFNMRDLLYTNSRVFKLQMPEFWDLVANPQPLGQDPFLTNEKFQLLCTNSLESWMYACRSLKLLDISNRHHLISYLAKKYDKLDPFKLNPNDMAVLDMNLPSGPLTPPDCPESPSWATFTVGQKAGLLHVRKIEIDC